ncbi:hypothetical protein INT44_007160 [Umbelopsis vinacea]|uniref:Uncharacterized protein n=1 Tax=Umbelopsis vinacea TaxID=44442 RepID=A0A8H7PH83_9FUNG|nr:hypothetical protein INT44_007160 [Umbelopsis vinacea]
MVPDYRSDSIAKRRIRQARVLLRGLYFLCSSMTLTSCIIALVIYCQNANKFPEPLEIWPTIMVLIVASISFALCLSVILSYFCTRGGVKTANVIDRYRFFFHWSTILGFIIVWAVTTSVFHVKSGRPNDLWAATCTAAKNDLIEGNDIWTICTASIWISGCGFTNVGLHVFELVVSLSILPLQALRMKLKRDIDQAERTPMASSYMNEATPFEPKSLDESWHRVDYHDRYRKVDNHSFDSIKLQVV